VEDRVFVAVPMSLPGIPDDNRGGLHFSGKRENISASFSAASASVAFEPYVQTAH